ncbi:hypothetical protein EVAR_14644_1 [Eumeta japonica]|uniref:Uncharacterized protein n=1 Tax=Eumeta variegata TaxID=151549 RepID=A0A4C1U209_EUMVA|nr:hypothetical protein EVAR_14644_1 [Eumeta japonica]
MRKKNGTLLAIVCSKSITRQARLAILNGILIPTLMLDPIINQRDRHYALAGTRAADSCRQLVGNRALANEDARIGRLDMGNWPWNRFERRRCHELLITPRLVTEINFPHRFWLLLLTFGMQ